METVVQLAGIGAGVGLVVWGAERFAEHLAAASARLGLSSFALALLLAGAEPEELATAVTAALRDAPAIALGDVAGANITVCLVALGLAAVIAPVPMGGAVRRWALLAVPLTGIAAALAWDGRVGRVEGAALVALYIAFVALIWRVERRPPAIGEVAELDEDRPTSGRVGRDLIIVIAGVVAMAGGALLLVESVRELTDVEATQSKLGVIVIGFATAFELVVLAWTSARRGVPEAVAAAVVGSVAYNATMTLGAGALARPLQIADPSLLRGPWLATVAALLLGVTLSWRSGLLGRTAGVMLLVAYPLVATAIALNPG